MGVLGKVLFVDDEEHLRRAVEQTFELANIPVTCFDRAELVIGHVSREFSGVVISDIRMPGMGGTDLLRKLLEVDYELPVILVTGHGDVQMAVEAMRAGAYDFIEKPFSPDHLVEVVRRAMDKRRLTLENRELRIKVTSRDDLETRLTGRTETMINLRKSIRAIAPTDVDVLVTGNTGSGKGVVARALHDLSGRSQRPFVTINCGGLSGPLFESELFGHEQGAFAGAMRSRVGKFEHARGGTVFLDEIESMPVELQVKLLRVFEERSISRLGSGEVIELDVRFVTASKDDLEQLTAMGRFRSDLYYRLRGVELKVPPLSERREDIPRLFVQLANEASRRFRRDFAEIPDAVLSMLATKEWPGNVRELRNEAERYVLGINFEDSSGGAPATLSERMAAHEKSLIASELGVHGGALKPTYQSLGISRKSLYEKMQRYGLAKIAFRHE